MTTLQSSTRPVAPPADARARPSRTLDLTVVIPLFNEVEGVQRLYDAVVTELEPLGRTFEVIFVDDGSHDGTYAELTRLADRDERIRVIRFRRNFGQTAAMSAGFDHASGAAIVAMDGDLQNDPADIGMLLDKLDEGYDIVSGWRKHRADPPLRRLPSRIANWLIGRVTGVRLHDYGCSLKAYRAEVVKGTRLYGEMHRFIPALAHDMGANICELPVRHHPRTFGTSKYGIKRTLKVLLDLVTVKFFSGYSTKPIYIFGGTGVLLCTVGIGAAAITLYEKYVQGVFVHNNPLILVAIFLFSIGINFILMGLLAEMNVRTYHESQSKPTYWVRELRNFPSDGDQDA